MEEGRAAPGLRTPAPPPEGWRPFLGLIAVATLILIIRLVLAARVGSHWLGSDDLLYTHLARNLAAGRGFVVDYVQFHFVPYDRVYGLPEDFVGPLASLLMVPSVRLLGANYLGYVLPSAVLGTLVVPLVVRALAWRITGSARAGWMAAWLTLFNPLVFALAQRAITDIPYLTWFLLAMYWFLRLSEHRRAALWCGLFVGLAALTRTQGLVLLGLFPLAEVVRTRQLRALVGNRVLVLIATGLAVYAPWLIRNQVIFGEPMHSLYSVFCGMVGQPGAVFVGDPDWGRWFELWWDRPLPSARDRYADLLPALAIVLRYLGTAALHSVGVYSDLGWAILRRVPLLLLVPLARVVAAGWSVWQARRQPETQVLLLVMLANMVSVSLTYLPAETRYMLPNYALVTVYIAWGCALLAVRLVADRRRQSQALGGIALCAALLGAGLVVGKRAEWDSGVQTPAQVRHLDELEQAETLIPPGSVVLSNHVLLDVNALDRGTVAIPRGSRPAEIRAVAEHYQATWAVVDQADSQAALTTLGWQPVMAGERITVLRRPTGDRPR